VKEDIAELKSEFKAKLLFWNNIKSKKLKVALIVLFVGLVGLKILTSIFTFDWLVSFFN
jgi:hypothetical protein